MQSNNEIESIFSNLNSHVVSSKSLIERPYRNEDVFFEGQILETLDDGMEIELCLWTDCDCHMSFWDVSINKALFDEKENDFLSYLKDKGLHLENVKDKFGEWRYCGLIENDDVYRIQYCEENGLEKRNEINEANIVDGEGLNK